MTFHQPITYTAYCDIHGKAYAVNVDPEMLFQHRLRFNTGVGWIFGFPGKRTPDIVTSLSKEWINIAGYNVVVKHIERDIGGDN